MNLREAIQTGGDLLSEAGVEDAKIDARNLLEYVTGCGLTEYALNPFRELSLEEEEKFLELLEKRRQRVPLQHLTGVQEFMGISFAVDGRVLIPRQDTELLVEEALKIIRPGMRVLDLCTGSGCIIISLEQLSKKRGLTDGTNVFTGSDISGEALDVAKINVSRTQASVTLVESDIFDHIRENYDLIVSNPPYIESDVIGTLQQEVRDYDPRLALDGGADGLVIYRRLIRQAYSHLPDGGVLLMEIGADQGDAVSGLMRDVGFGSVSVLKDWSHHDRVVSGKKG